jgi:predicted nicotinamide N-methyase
VTAFAAAAVALNAAANAVTVTAVAADILAEDAAAECAADAVLVADAFYARDFAGGVLRFLRRARAGGADILVGDLGRRYLPRSGFAELAAYDVPALRSLEDADVKRTAVWRPAW